jgi:hypothetical protein
MCKYGSITSYFRLFFPNFFPNFFPYLYSSITWVRAHVSLFIVRIQERSRFICGCTPIDFVNWGYSTFLLCKKSAHWDGYFSGVGDWLCTQIKRLLEKYSIPEINAMLDALEVEESESHNFNTDDLIPFIEGKTVYGNDMCDDIEYEYRLDFHFGTFEGSGNGETRVLRLDQIRAGNQISSEDTDDDDTDAKEDETAVC